ncbi:MAG: ABC transporter permease [Anaerolineales bacterium]|nr:ABC transporter permease [Anaerolineales bacterium]
MNLERDLFVAWLFLKRSVLSMLSYRTALLLSLFTGFLSVVQFGLMAKFISEGNDFPLIAQYGGDLLAYLIIGSTFTSFVGVALSSFQGAIRSEQQMGTLEYLLLADLPVSKLMFFSAIWNFTNALLNTAVLFGIVAVVFKITLSMNLFLVVGVLMLSVLSLSGIGMISAGTILVTKRGDPVGWIFTTATGLLAGVVFPVELLPQWLRSVSNLLPTTHALHALRLALTAQAQWQDLKAQVLYLVLTLVITFPLGLVIFQAGLNKARRVGSLADY